MYLTKGVYRQIGNIQIVNWRSDIANLYYAKNITERKSRLYLDVVSNELGNAITGFEYIYHVMLRRNFVLDPEYSKVDTFVCGKPSGQLEKTESLYETGEIDPFLLNVLEQKRAENKLTDIIVSIQANQNAIIRHDSKKV